MTANYVPIGRGHAGPACGVLCARSVFVVRKVNFRLSRPISRERSRNAQIVDAAHGCVLHSRFRAGLGHARHQGGTPDGSLLTLRGDSYALPGVEGVVCPCGRKARTGARNAVQLVEPVRAR